MPHMKRPTKYVFITGGVVSGLGKGIATASLGNIFRARGFLVNIQKCDPYLNFDAGTLNPAEHGEVYVLDDGAETDLDLGHYERFIGKDLTKNSSIMQGQVYNRVLEAERKGDYLGKTVQIIPHITNEIQKTIINSSKGFDIQFVEIGGSVGDYEGLAFMEAIRQIKRRVGAENVLYIHLVFLPYLETSKEIKTKPAQNTVRDLRELGIHPDVLMVRCDHPISMSLLEKLSLYCDVPVEAIVPLPTAKSVYQVPLMMESSGIGNYITKQLGLPKRKPKFSEWIELVEKIRKPKKVVTIGMVAKYLANEDTYMSITEAFKAAGWSHNVNVKIKWIDSEALEIKGIEMLAGLDGIAVGPGFGNRGTEGKIMAAKYARESKIPYFGICLGMQIAVIEFARNVLGLKDANSTEMDENTRHPVIDIMPDQKKIDQKGGTMRLGAYPCVLSKKSLSYLAYGSERISERHRHRYEFNNAYRKKMTDAGLRLVGMSPNKKLVEIIEVDDHPFMVGTQFHPEFHSRPNSPHPLFSAFVAASLKHSFVSKLARPSQVR